MKLKEILFEMPHAEYSKNSNFGLVDFRVEKYHVSKEEKHNLIKSFHDTGFVGLSKLTNEWMYFSPTEVRKATAEEINLLPALPNNWEDFLFNIQ